MNTRGKLWIAALLAALAIGAAGCGGSDTASQNQKDKVYNVGILQLVEHPALDAANKGFVDGLAAKGFVEGKNVKGTNPTFRPLPSALWPTKMIWSVPLPPRLPRPWPMPPRPFPL